MGRPMTRRVSVGMVALELARPRGRSGSPSPRSSESVRASRPRTRLDPRTRRGGVAPLHRARVLRFSPVRLARRRLRPFSVCRLRPGSARAVYPSCGGRRMADRAAPAGDVESIAACAPLTPTSSCD